jgi:deoxyribodipyrimidine photo-lyase
MKPISIYIFTRDLRLADNVSLLESSHFTEKKILPLFVFTPEQADSKKNAYFSDNAFQFMVDSLMELNSDIKKLGSSLTMFIGSHLDVLAYLLKHVGFDEVHCVRDVTPYSVERSAKIESWCKTNSVTFADHDDLDLFPLSEGLLPSRNAYKKYTPYLRAVEKKIINRPISKQWKKSDFFSGKIPKTSGKSLSLLTDFDDLKKLYRPNDAAKRGGRSLGLKLIRDINLLKNYKTMREIPSIKGTSRLSPHLKFGTISVREVYWHVRDMFGRQHELIRQLFWRSFYLRVTYYYSWILKGKPLQLKYENLKFNNDKKEWRAWCDGKTGFPLVDAGMRCLNETGYLHNRLRMLVASFLVKSMLIDYRWGEKYFAQKLTDYDPSNNINGFMWCASVGSEIQPWFRMFNPFRQSEKYDKDCEFIKRWVPELTDVPCKDVHNWDSACRLHPKTYMKPIIDMKQRKVEYTKLMKFASTANPDYSKVI